MGGGGGGEGGGGRGGGKEGGKGEPLDFNQLKIYIVFNTYFIKLHPLQVCHFTLGMLYRFSINQLMSIEILIWHGTHTIILLSCYLLIKCLNSCCTY